MIPTFIRLDAEEVGRHDLGNGRAILEDADGMHYYEHECNRRATQPLFPFEALRAAPRLSDHTRTGPLETITIRASILCPDCGDHGFVTDGQWSDT